MNKEFYDIQYIQLQVVSKFLNNSSLSWPDLEIFRHPVHFLWYSGQGSLLFWLPVKCYFGQHLSALLHVPSSTASSIAVVVVVVVMGCVGWRSICHGLSLNSWSGSWSAWVHLTGDTSRDDEEDQGEEEEDGEPVGCCPVVPGLSVYSYLTQGNFMLVSTWDSCVGQLLMFLSMSMSVSMTISMSTWGLTVGPANLNALCVLCVNVVFNSHIVSRYSCSKPIPLSSSQTNSWRK